MLDSHGVHRIRDYNAGFLEEVIKARKKEVSREQLLKLLLTILE